MNPIAFLAVFFFMAERDISAALGKCPPFPDQCEPLYICVTFDYNSCPICKCVTATSTSTSTTNPGTQRFSYTTVKSPLDLSHRTDDAGMLTSILTKDMCHLMIHNAIQNASFEWKIPNKWSTTLTLNSKTSLNSIWTATTVDVTPTLSPVSNTVGVSTLHHSLPTESTLFTFAAGGTFGPKAPGCTSMNCLLDCGNPPKYRKDIFGCNLCECAT